MFYLSKPSRVLSCGGDYLNKEGNALFIKNLINFASSREEREIITFVYLQHMKQTFLHILISLLQS